MSGQHLSSHGRGGAGNMADVSKSPKIQPKDLETPTLKTSVVTTGRGGAGNLVGNTDAGQTRALQDVNPVARRESAGASHGGRGGAGNVFNSTDAEAARQAQDGSAVVEDGGDKKKEKSLVDKVKESILGKK